MTNKQNSFRPPNRFERLHCEPSFDDVAWDQEYLAKSEKIQIEYLDDVSDTIVSSNQSPDVPFRYSVNPYRGCLHACSYCYARPTHEYLGFDAGADFETKIIVKRRAPALFRTFLARPSWQPEPIAFSGVTDCYQPAERTFRLTRQCLQVALEFNQPVLVITKNALIVRDLDLLTALAQKNLVRIRLSITTLQSELARAMEPRTSIPAARLRAISKLVAAEVPTGVLMAPIIPGLNDSEIPAVLQAAHEAGAQSAGYVLLRLPMTVQPVFEAWLRRTQGDRADRILSRIKQTRDGKSNDAVFGQRMRGTGELAGQIRQMFTLFQNKFDLNRPMPDLNVDTFRRPGEDIQGTLF